MFRQWSFDLSLYLCNRWIASVPCQPFRLWFYRVVMGFQFGAGSQCFMGAWFDCRRHLVVGARTVINRGCQLDNRGGIEIGDDVLLSPEVMIITADHDIHSINCAGRVDRVRIDRHVFIGSRALILPGVRIGEGAVVCAGGVVVKDVAPFSIVGGIPAKEIGRRTAELDYKTEYARWFH